MKNNQCSKCNRSYNIEVYPELITDNVCIYCSKNYPAIQTHVMAIYDNSEALNRHSWGNWFVVDDSMVKVCSSCDMMIKVEKTGTVRQNVHSYCDSNLVE